jgi:hypothetical protein
MGGLGDWLSVDVDCARQIDKQRFDHRSTTGHAGNSWLAMATVLWSGVCGVTVGVWISGARSRQAAARASSRLLGSYG